MNKYNIITYLCIGIFIVFVVFGLLNIFVFNDNGDSSGRDYKISNGDIDFIINDNGSVSVSEVYTYNFNGSYQGVRRNIPLKSEEKINNLQVYIDGAYGKVSENEDYGEYNITTYLYSNPDKTERISNNAEVNITYEYEIDHVVKFFKDTAEFQYKIWGNTWDRPAEKLTAHIHYPSNDKVEYWINPYEYKDTPSKWDGNTLIITRNEKTDNYLEINSLIPLKEFSTTDPVTYHNEKQIDKVRQTQENYVKDYESDSHFLPLLGLLELLSLIIPLGIYIKYGREPKIAYNSIYEREAPSNDKPAFVNAMGVAGSLKSIGNLNENAFKATIMDLINRKYLILIHNDEKDTVKLQIANKNLQELESFEIEAINLLRRFEINGIIDFNHMDNELQSESRARGYMNSIEEWKDNYKGKFITPRFSEFFHDKGARYIKYYGIVQIILSVLIIAFSFFRENQSASFILLIISIIVLAISIMLVILPNTIGGQWTVEGREYYKKWDNFKKYLQDFSLMKEYPPESIVVWNEYLVYATALGVAEEVEKAMGKLVYSDSGYYDYSDPYIFYHYGGYYAFNRTFNTANSTINQANTSTIGSIGGGSGGGGGGAF